jgi:peptidoglycan/xylan/chitin deacetylase (PgdA/CDA1 family)
MRIIRPGLISRLLYPDALFRISSVEKVLWLTFDDGPDPGSTERILQILEKPGIKALFFCSGNGARNYPELMEKIRSGGHVIGNHGYAHIDGFKTSRKEYCRNVYEAAGLTSSELFRPPYGRLRLSQYMTLRNNYLIFLWDVMPYDFDHGLSSSDSFSLLKRNIRPGSVIVLHDKPASSALDYLEEFIIFCQKNGFRFDIPMPPYR